ncbi:MULTISPECIES: hybrid sensor histidine kinase/response regulator [Chryseobacterium]|uniref:histidine kinase n=1 Tax=Chryseobacterium cucumeris TaxID=1813611 RepID=A0ABX9X8C1_9FLAO|nr:MULTISPECIES: response regulator [Chryseobacterium]MDH5033582.1 response regulator [Chryseobacterium cucumeris]RKE81131.1 PAS domain S-box-containing protein [Chryseobacterium sp. AG363]ROH94324.1 response regulator [Chryseobacterium cucumeris]WFB68177.1 response regulator [Chryseobacterium sp. WX]
MILIVDDNQSNLYSLQKLLESKDFQVETANSGEEALAKALKNDYALIILDVQMPDMDGFEVAETLADYSKTKEVPIIFLSAVNTDKKFITKGYASGAKDYVTKPVDPEILLLKVKTFYNLQEQNIAMKKAQQNLELEVKGRRESQVTMKSQIDHFHLMLESLPQIAFTLNEAGTVDFVNGKWYEYSDSEQNFPEIYPDDPDITEEFERCRKKGKALELEVRIKNVVSGNYRYHLLRVTPVYDEGRIKNWVGTFTDIDDQKKVEKEKDEFLSIASHELKTPLTSIKAYVQLLERKLKLDKESSEAGFVAKVQGQIEKLNTLITDLLDVSKIENGKLKINKKPVNLENLINNAIETIIQTHDQREVKIERHGTKPDILIPLDEIRIEQVLINFLTNAIKYSPDNNQVIVTTFVDEEAEEVRVNVTDFGIGIPDFKQDAVFKKFYRVEESSLQFQGMGIGLFICSEIIKQHHGSVGVSSIVDEGSTFYFTLPLN